jgi:hypothetical protein
MTRTEYIAALRALYLAANNSDAGLDFDGSDLKPDWMRGHECSVHCSALDAIARDMDLGENWLEEPATVRAASVTPTAPTVNNNGTSATGLRSQQRAVYDAASHLLQSLRDATPHGRDYQTAPNHCDYEIARNQNHAAQRAANEIKADAMAIAIAIDVQGR